MMATFRQTRIAVYAFYVFKIEPPIANDDKTVPRNIVAVGFNFDFDSQKIDPKRNCPYWELAQEYGYEPRLALSPSEHLMCVNASTNGAGEKISIVQAQRNIQRFKPFLVKEKVNEQAIEASAGSSTVTVATGEETPPDGRRNIRPFRSEEYDDGA